MKTISRRFLFLIILVLLIAASACSAPHPQAKSTGIATPIPTITPAITPAPTATTVQTPASTATATPAPLPTTIPTVTPSPTITPSQTPSPTPILTPAPTPVTGPAEVTVTRNEVSVDFPDSIAFTLEGSSSLPVANIDLKYGTSKRSLASSEVSRITPQFAPGSRIRASWTWEMKKTGSLPPGATVWWQWNISDDAGRKYATPPQTIILEDRRFQWQSQTGGDMTIYWYGQEAGFGEILMTGVESKLSRLDLKVSIPEELKIKVFVYTSTGDLRSAVLFTQEWTGGLAFTEYNIILITIAKGQLESGKSMLAHEITHLMVREATFGPFGDIPTWLSEGLASYAEGELTSYEQQALNEAITGNKLLSVRSLSSSFPADPGQAYLAYAQSYSLVKYLIDTYGWTKMRELLSVFKAGSSYNSALQKVYSFDMDGLDRLWRASIGAG